MTRWSQDIIDGCVPIIKVIENLAIPDITKQAFTQVVYDTAFKICGDVMVKVYSDCTNQLKVINNK